MYGANESRRFSESKSEIYSVQFKRSLRYASTADIRAFLCDLKMRPQTQRRLLCRLLRRAAAHASTTNSVVHPVEAHHKPTP
jgi:hypothetical protein